jgi:hypothetical protein
LISSILSRRMTLAAVLPIEVMRLKRCQAAGHLRKNHILSAARRRGSGLI